MLDLSVQHKCLNTQPLCVHWWSVTLSFCFLSPSVTFSNFVSISSGAHALQGHMEDSSHWAGSILGCWIHPLWAESGPEVPLWWQDGGGQFKIRVLAASNSVFLEPEPGESETGFNQALFKVRNVGSSRLPSGEIQYWFFQKATGFRLTYLVMVRDTMAGCCLPLHTPVREAVRRCEQGGMDIVWASGSKLIVDFFLLSSLQN